MYSKSLTQKNIPQNPSDNSSSTEQTLSSCIISGIAIRLYRPTAGNCFDMPWKTRQEQVQTAGESLTPKAPRCSAPAAVRRERQDLLEFASLMAHAAGVTRRHSKSETKRAGIPALLLGFQIVEIRMSFPILILEDPAHHILVDSLL